MFTKSLVAAATLLSLVGAASATTTNLGTLPIGATSFGGLAAPGAFLDTFTFVLPANGGSAYTVAGFPAVVPGFAITLTSLTLFNSSNVAVASDNTVPLGLNFAANAGGSYYLEVAGTATGPSGGLYNGAISVTAVPEPGTYALMLAGLGAVGFVAARRRPRA